VTLSVAVVCEAPADRITITTLAERVIREAAPWIEPEVLGNYVEWRGFLRSEPHLEWTDVRKRATELKLEVRFRGVAPLHPYAQNALRAIRVLALAPERVDAIILLPDSDGDLDRLKGLEQARDYAREALPIVIGLAHTKRECWHTCGFEPGNDTEHELLKTERDFLGFDPRLKSHELTAKHDPANDKRSAKRVLAALTANDRDRELECLAALDRLHERGEHNGLRAFLEEVRTRLVPLFVK
jgi:hypothetical protein